MTLENSERIWLDELWSLWQCDQPIDLEEPKQRDIWEYPQTEELAAVPFQADNRHLMPHSYLHQLKNSH